MSVGAIFQHGQIQWQPSYALLCQTPFCQTACSAAICPTTTKCNGILVGKFNLCCHINNIHLKSWASIIKLEALLSEQPFYFLSICFQLFLSTSKRNELLFFSPLRKIFCQQSITFFSFFSVTYLTWKTEGCSAFSICSAEETLVFIFKWILHKYLQVTDSLCSNFIFGD